MTPAEIYKLFVARGNTLIKNTSVDSQQLIDDSCWSSAIEDPEVTKLLISIAGADGLPYIRTKNCENGAQLMTIGGMDQSLFLLLNGKLEISTVDNDILQIKGKEWIGERFFADIFRGRTANVTTIGQADLIEINSALFEADPRLQLLFKELIIQILDKKIGVLYRHFAEMKSKMTSA